MLTLHIADDIDDDFKVILYYQKLIDYILQVPVSKEDDFLVALEYEVLSMDYEKLIEVAQGLKTITEHVKQVLFLIQIFINCLIISEIGSGTNTQRRYYK